MSTNENESKNSDTVTEKKENVENDKKTDITARLEDVGPEDIETSETAECVTMVDVLQDENDLEEDARAVLGGADDRNCTYNDTQSNGYLKRQALYACLTCSVPNDPSFKPAGICLACSYACHNDHTLVELYTKRRFRCDCGNSKFPKSNPCKLYENKVSENDKNEYNQNYRGVYCSCHRPYPDEEDTVPDAMIQCAICEDWYHRRHLKVEDDKYPNDSAFAELICHLCSEKYYNAFLYGYKGYSTCYLDKNFEDNVSTVNVDGNNDPTNSCCSQSDEAKNEEISGGSTSSDRSQDQKGEKQKCSTDKKCFLQEEKVQVMKNSNPTSMFMLQGWREQLCKCSDCVTKYKHLALEYLLDHEDTVHHYESKAVSEKSSQYEDGMKELSKMERTKQIEAIHGYNSMKSNLMEYLKKFAENKKVVREEDIQEFFQQMAGNKKMRANIPDSCR